MSLFIKQNAETMCKKWNAASIAIIKVISSQVSQITTVRTIHSTENFQLPIFKEVGIPANSPQCQTECSERSQRHQQLHLAIYRLLLKC